MKSKKKKRVKDRLINERNSRPRIIICRLLRFKDKQRIIRSSKNLKNTDILIYKDFCKDTMETVVNSYGIRYWNIEPTTKFLI